VDRASHAVARVSPRLGRLAAGEPVGQHLQTLRFEPALVEPSAERSLEVVEIVREFTFHQGGSARDGTKKARSVIGKVERTYP
jgi:hypothetical protein